MAGTRRHAKVKSFDSYSQGAERFVARDVCLYEWAEFNLSIHLGANVDLILGYLVKLIQILHVFSPLWISLLQRFTNYFMYEINRDARSDEARERV